jgi:hypothetical protein
MNKLFQSRPKPPYWRYNLRGLVALVQFTFLYVGMLLEDMLGREQR